MDRVNEESVVAENELRVRMWLSNDPKFTIKQWDYYCGRTFWLSGCWKLLLRWLPKSQKLVGYLYCLRAGANIRRSRCRILSFRHSPSALFALLSVFVILFCSSVVANARITDCVMYLKGILCDFLIKLWQFGHSSLISLLLDWIITCLFTWLNFGLNFIFITWYIIVEYLLGFEWF